MSKEGLFDDIPAGATITAIRPLESDPNIRSVRVGRRAVARLRAADIEGLGLEVGLEWSNELATAVDDARKADLARRAALRLLSRRARSVAEVTLRLEGSGHRTDLVARIVRELVESGWLDDESFSRSAARHIVERGPAAPLLIEHQLGKRGIDEDLARRIASETLGDGDPLEAAMDMARRQQRTLAGKPPIAIARRIGQALARRGFDDEAVRTVLERLGVMAAAEAAAAEAAAAREAAVDAEDAADAEGAEGVAGDVDPREHR